MFRSKSNFEKVFDKATSNLLLEPDLDSMLQLCDMIRGGEIKPREAALIVKTRVIEEKNPHVQLFSLSVLDTLMKNCGDMFHTEVITESYMESLKEVAKNSTSDKVKNKLLEMIQSWGIGFKEKTKLNVATNLYNIMKAEGFNFPPASDTSDMFKSEKAPTWSDGDECGKCKSEFGLVTRKHHCRACGGIFCGKCTSKQAIIPKFGIEKEVRVCDSCYNTLKISAKSSKLESDLPAEYLSSALAKQSQEPPKRDEAALKEEEELQLALALSLDEQANRERIRKEQITSDPVYGTVNKPVVASAPVPTQPHTVDPVVDPDLARYLNRSYWDKKKVEQEKKQPDKEVNSVSSERVVKKSTKEADIVDNEPGVIEAAKENPAEPAKQEEVLQNGGNDEIPDHSELLRNLQTSVEIFVNRMRSDKMRGRSIANDSTVQSLFQSINNMHPTLIQFMNELEEKRLHQEALQDKLVQLKDARAALDALRTEHAEKLRRAAEEAERLRQIQMAKKLELMRQKKQEYLAYQRQVALQRMQEQEAARQARLEQQKQFIQQRAMQPSMIVAGYNTQYLPPQTTAGDIGQEQVPQQQSPYMPYSGYVPQQRGQSSQPYQPQTMYTPVQQGNAGYAPANFNNTGAYDTSAYQQPGVTTTPNMQSVQPNMDAYNMSDMNTALPTQTVSATGAPTLQQQVVATAPPATPQPGQNPQQMMTAQADPMSGYQMQQQHMYQQQPISQQDMQGVPTNQPTAQQPYVQEPLISFD
ncbi:hepatocyte growth factor-regulated tyrosine kinase substrate-like isoform X1 [Clavelina lepadiformis]|uniref:hepatocyte growth factor-regulated tyrosine kinase substrate-like isoform X1 n=1 Tax=Clavelina lepadiformis TaxID=159417 RepID=UPI004041AA6E